MDLFRITGIVCCLFFLFGFAVADTQTTVIGGLLPLSGNLSGPAPAYKAAMELATEDLNAKYTELGLPYHIQLRIVDTESDPVVAKERGEEMIQDDIHFIIGPASSSEMKALEDDAKESDTILIGFGSTTPGISSTENTIIRLCPDDTVQALALQRYFKKTNITTVIPVVRNDIYGRELYELLNNLSPNGNFSVTEPIFYEPGTSSFNQTIDEVSKSVQDTGSKSGLAVLIIGYNEAADILKVAYKHPDLEKVSWFGTDGIALVDTVIKNKDIAAFAAKTNFTASIFGELENEPSFLEFSKRIQDAAGMNATPYAVVINDCIQLAAMTDLMSQGISNKRAIFVNNANHFYGVTGYTSLTDSGDRKYSNIDFWKIKENEGAYSWTKTAQFINQMAGPMVNLKK